MQLDSAVLFFDCDNDDASVTNAVSFSAYLTNKHQIKKSFIIFSASCKNVYRSYYSLSVFHRSFVQCMRLNFVVGLAYCCYLAAEARLLLDVSALDIWLVYLLMIVVAVVLMNDGPMVVIRISPVDLELYSANNHYLYHPESTSNHSFSNIICSIFSFYEHTEPFSETAAPDALSDKSRSLSGSTEPFYKCQIELLPD